MVVGLAAMLLGPALAASAAAFSRKGRMTTGGRLVGLAVVEPGGGDIGYIRACLRYLLYGFCLLPLGAGIWWAARPAAIGLGRADHLRLPSGCPLARGQGAGPQDGASGVGYGFYHRASGSRPADDSQRLPFGRALQGRALSPGTGDGGRNMNLRKKSCILAGFCLK